MTLFAVYIDNDSLNKIGLEIVIESLLLSVAMVSLFLVHLFFDQFQFLSRIILVCYCLLSVANAVYLPSLNTDESTTEEVNDVNRGEEQNNTFVNIKHPELRKTIIITI